MGSGNWFSLACFAFIFVTTITFLVLGKELDVRAACAVMSFALVLINYFGMDGICE